MGVSVDLMLDRRCGEMGFEREIVCIIVVSMPL